MTDSPYARADRYFTEHYRLDLDTLLAPIDASAPSGRSMRETRYYAALRQARMQDDLSLPAGVWVVPQHKRADWMKAGMLAASMLAHQSKDLQLLTWLFEAQLHQHGFDGVAPPLVLLRETCARFWDTMLPNDADDDFEQREALLRLMDEKSLATLRLVTLVECEGRPAFSWADWDRAVRDDQAYRAGRHAADTSATSLPELQFTLGAASTESLAARHAVLGDGLAALGALREALAAHLGQAKPPLGRLYALLEQIHVWLGAALREREPGGMKTETETAAENVAPATVAAPAMPAMPETAALANADLAADLQRARTDAYARLAEIAEFLMRIEPHSPAPYLVRTAVEWSALPTPALYDKVFVQMNGQLDFFAMLGIARPHDKA
ncbi:type VI secretion system protein TssA [Burkholderia sp. Ac-20379]|uniref:type VI secretion system protein TssA n=1 Tax=Burkholderia sp. Ac-20379 TaxID=2703900 RepID=UPI00197EEA8B|nr:type VI secretion system protein TssA [Burkholderia sp. Ac-20379]MBN3728200.1 type VI secretion system protein TssA [Burkholderia sp. Ac-20379]